MRVLLVSTLFPNPLQPHRATFIREKVLAMGLRHEVRVVAPIAWTDELAARRRGRKGLPRSRQSELDGRTIDHPRFWFPPRFLRRTHGLCYQASVRSAFHRVVNSFQPDVVFTPWAYPDGWAMVRLGHRLNLPVVIGVLGSDVLIPSKSRSRRLATVDALRRADGVVAVSRDLADRVIESGADPDRVRVIYNGVDPARFRPGSKAEARTRLGIASDELLILFVGNLVPVKAVDVLLKSLATIAGRGSSFRAVLIGDGPLRGRLTRQVQESGLQDRVRFLGSLPHSDLPDWYRAASFVVLPSLSEGVPNVLLEAAACGTPFVASRVGGIPEISGLATSRLVPPGDSRALADAIRDLASGPRCAEPDAPRRTTIDCANEMVDFFDEVVREHRSGKFEGTSPASTVSTRSHERE